MDLSELFVGSFNGAKFLLVSASTQGGRKQVKHEYPYTSKQKIEDLGFRPRVFSISAIISADPPGVGSKTYRENRDALLSALEKGGVGTLSHPFYSNSIAVVARPYTIEEDTKNLGYSTIELEFDYSDENTSPQPAKRSLSQIGKILGRVNSSVLDSISRVFNVSSSAINFGAAQDLLESLGGSFATYSQAFSSIGEPLNSFFGLVTKFNSSIPSLIGSPSSLASSILEIIDSSSNLYGTIPQAIGVFSRFFSFGDDIVTVQGTTPTRIQRNRNNRVVSLGVQAAYLGLSYQFAATDDYRTVDQIETVQEALEAQFSKLAGDPDIDEDVINELSDLRTMVNGYFESEKLNAAQVVPIDVNEIPVSVLAFQYYGNVDNLDAIADELVDLNGARANDVSFIAGSVGVLTI